MTNDAHQLALRPHRINYIEVRGLKVPYRQEAGAVGFSEQKRSITDFDDGCEGHRLAVTKNKREKRI